MDSTYTTITVTKKVSKQLRIFAIKEGTRVNVLIPLMIKAYKLYKKEFAPIEEDIKELNETPLKRTKRPMKRMSTGIVKKKPATPKKKSTGVVKKKSTGIVKKRK